jgi:hypothetical protein
LQKVFVHFFRKFSPKVNTATQNLQVATKIFFIVRISRIWWWRESVDPIPEGTGFVIRNQVLLLCGSSPRRGVFLPQGAQRLMNYEL